MPNYTNNKDDYIHKSEAKWRREVAIAVTNEIHWGHIYF